MLARAVHDSFKGSTSRVQQDVHVYVPIRPYQTRVDGSLQQSPDCHRVPFVRRVMG